MKGAVYNVMQGMYEELYDTYKKDHGIKRMSPKAKADFEEGLKSNERYSELKELKETI